MEVGDEVTVTATTKSGYTFVGWFNDEEFLSSELSYTFSMPATDTTLTAKWVAYTVTTSKNFDDAGNITNYSNQKVSVGTTVTITASTNTGYIWLGWYDGDELLANELSYTFEMPDHDVSYIAKWKYYTVTVEKNNSSAGTAYTALAVSCDATAITLTS